MSARSRPVCIFRRIILSPEIINPDTGEVLPEGEVGELVFTCITKKAFPLIRYRTRDLCYLTRKKCSCGRTHIRMHKPMGRSDDMMVIKGVNVFPSQIETVLLKRGYQANYQIIVDPEGQQRHLPGKSGTDAGDGGGYDPLQRGQGERTGIQVEIMLGIRWM